MESIQRKIHLVRHGESEWNRIRKVQGNGPGIGLSDRGRLQARLLGERLSGEFQFDVVICSDVERAVETAAIALGDGRPVDFRPQLREIGFGAWEGKLVSEIKESYPGELEKWFTSPSKVSIEGAEDYIDFHRRVVGEMEDIVSTTDGDLLVICHGGVICTYLTHILRMDPDDLWSFSLPNTSITTVVLEFRPRLRLLGDASHLNGEALGFDGMPSTVR